MQHTRSPSAFSPPPLSSISPCGTSTRQWRYECRDWKCANVRLGSRTFRVCCVLRKGSSGRHGESARRREDWTRCCNRDRKRRGKRNVPVSITGTLRCAEVSFGATLAMRHFRFTPLTIRLKLR